MACSPWGLRPGGQLLAVGRHRHRLAGRDVGVVERHLPASAGRGDAALPVNDTISAGDVETASHPAGIRAEVFPGTLLHQLANRARYAPSRRAAGSSLGRCRCARFRTLPAGARSDAQDGACADRVFDRLRQFVEEEIGIEGTHKVVPFEGGWLKRVRSVGQAGWVRQGSCQCGPSLKVRQSPPPFDRNGKLGRRALHRRGDLVVERPVPADRAADPGTQIDGVAGQMAGSASFARLRPRPAASAARACVRPRERLNRLRSFRSRARPRGQGRDARRRGARGCAHRV